MTAKYLLQAVDEGLCITGGLPPLRNTAGAPPPAERGQRALPPYGAEPEQLAEGEDELERTRR
jgi:hypothetical protein